MTSLETIKQLRREVIRKVSARKVREPTAPEPAAEPVRDDLEVRDLVDEIRRSRGGEDV